MHRDIKPENILLSGDASYLADFGIALVDTEDRLTLPGAPIGTPAYMSPEQVEAREQLDGRSDEYALACVAYEMLAGEPPFPGPTVQAIIARLLSEEPRSLAVQRKSVPVPVELAVHRGVLQEAPRRSLGTRPRSSRRRSRLRRPPSPESSHAARAGRVRSRGGPGPA